MLCEKVELQTHLINVFSSGGFIGYFHVADHSRALVATASVETCPSTPQAKLPCFQGAATPMIGCL